MHHADRDPRRRAPVGVAAAAMVVLLAACSGTLVQATPTPFFPSESPAAASETPASTAGGSASPSAEAVNVELTIDTAAGAAEFSYVQTALEAPAGSTIKLTLANLTNPDDEIGHNWVLVQPGQEDIVLANGIAAGDDRDWLNVDDPGIIAATRLIEGGERDPVTFAAPPPGSYTFVCTFPQHYAGGMKGTLTIK